MADPDPTAEAILYYANAISERVVEGKCPACGSPPETWSVPTDRCMSVQWVRLVNGRPQLTGDGHLAIGFTCGHCGYVRVHIPPTDLLEQ